MALQIIEDSDFTGGVNKEISPWRLPPGSLANANNMLFDEPGIARARNGASSLAGPTATAFTGALGWAYSQDTTTIEELAGWDGSTGRLSRINSLTGVQTALGTALGAAAIPGRPVRHFGFLFVPFVTLIGSVSARYMAIYAGIQTNTTGTNGVATNPTTANNPQMTLSGADVTTNYRVGAVMSVWDGVSKYYIGRIVSIDTAKLFTVWPMPRITLGLTPIGAVSALPVTSALAGKCMCSFQNRLLWGNTHDYGNAAVINMNIVDRRVIYSILPTETQTSFTLGTVDGAAFAQGSAEAPRLNYFDVPGSDPIVAMEPVSDNELLILTTQGVIIFRGTLATQTTTSQPGITFDISPLNTNAGCLSDLAVVRTPHGIIWPSSEGVMLYTGGGRTPIDLTEGKYHTTWRSYTAEANFAVHGAFYARNHYVVSLSTATSGTISLAFNLDTQTWSPLSGAGTDTFNGASRPTVPTAVFVGRWWDQTGAAPSQTGGHVVRVDPMFLPNQMPSAQAQDPDGTAVAASITSRTLTGDIGDERFLRRLEVRYELPSFNVAPTATVSVGARLDSRDTTGTTSVQVGLLSSTYPMALAGQTNATPIVISVTAGAHGLQSGDEVDIRGVTTNSNANGHWRITVINSTTFSLNGSSGNGATTATGTVKKITESEFDCGAVDPGQGHWVTITTTGVNTGGFRLYGIRTGSMMLRRGMSMSR